MNNLSGPVLKYSGAKWSLASWLAARLPPHGCYCEPFFGTGALFFTKAPSAVETINDLSGEVVNFFRVCRDRPEQLCRALELTPWSREEYEACRTGPQPWDDLERARQLAVVCWQQIGARYGAERMTGGWRSTKDPGCNPVGTWHGLPDRIRAAALRLREAQIECRPALDVIRRYANPEVLFYCDPPYPRVTRSRWLYAHEMSDGDHEELLEALEAHPGPVLLSGYPCALYEDRLRHWTCQRRMSRAQSAAERMECLWINPIADRAMAQKCLDFTPDPKERIGCRPGER